MSDNRLIGAAATRQLAIEKGSKGGRETIVVWQAAERENVEKRSVIIKIRCILLKCNDGT